MLKIAYAKTGMKRHWQHNLTCVWAEWMYWRGLNNAAKSADHYCTNFGSKWPYQRPDQVNLGFNFCTGGGSGALSFICLHLCWCHPAIHFAASAFIPHTFILGFPLICHIWGGSLIRVFLLRSKHKRLRHIKAPNRQQARLMSTLWASPRKSSGRIITVITHHVEVFDILIVRCSICLVKCYFLDV